MSKASLNLSVATASPAQPRGSRYKPDDLDRAILKLLQEDGRRQYGSIARELGVSDGTVRNRIMQMLDADVFRIFAVADPVALGYEGYAMLLIKLAPGADPDAVGLHFRDLPNVTFVSFTAGQYALLVEVVMESPQALHRFLKEECYSRTDIAELQPLIGLKMYKNALQWNLPGILERT